MVDLNLRLILIDGTRFWTDFHHTNRSDYPPVARDKLPCLHRPIKSPCNPILTYFCPISYIILRGKGNLTKRERPYGKKEGKGQEYTFHHHCHDVWLLKRKFTPLSLTLGVLDVKFFVLPRDRKSVV